MGDEKLGGKNIYPECLRNNGDEVDRNRDCIKSDLARVVEERTKRATDKIIGDCLLTEDVVRIN